MFAIHQIVTNLHWAYNLKSRTRRYSTLDESNRMKPAYLTFHPGKNPPPQIGCRLKSVFFTFKKHRFHILHFPNSTRLFTKPTGRHYTKYRFSRTLAYLRHRRRSYMPHKLLTCLPAAAVTKGRGKVSNSSSSSSMGTLEMGMPLVYWITR